jgi:outer membrane protein OmpA-like peptidoglycan-associated protein
MKISKTYSVLTNIALAILLTCNITFSQQKTASGKLNRFVAYSISDEINTSYDEINPVFSSDGNTIYFSRVNHPENHYGDFRSQDIWYSELQGNGSWGEPLRVEATFNENRYNTIYSITVNGDYLISGEYSKKGKYKKRGLSIVTKSGNTWTLPVSLKVPKISKKDKGLISSYFLSKDGESMLLSYSSGWQQVNTRKLRYSYKKESGKWKAPKAIKNKELSKRFGSIESPFISDDGETLYFSAYGRKKSDSYKSDIYKMSKSGASLNKWSNLEKVDDVINSSYWENYFKLFNGDNWAVFTKADVGDDADIFIVKLTEPKPYVDLQGIVKLDNKALDQNFQVMINGEVVDSVRINKATSSYAVQLPLGSKYEIQAQAFEMEAKVEVIDAIDQLEYLPMNKDLELSLLPFLDLSGKVTLYDQPVGANFEVLVNGMSVDSLTVDTLTSTYSVRLPLGYSYELKAKSGNYIPGTATVNVAGEKRQVRIEKDISLTTIPYVDINGLLYNGADSTAITLAMNPQVLVNGVTIDSLTMGVDGYKVRLPWGRKYILQLLIDDFAPAPAIIDLINVKNYEKMSQDLYALPLEKYATLSGKVINMKDKQPVTEPYEIKVNGVQSVGSKVDIQSGEYEVHLALGKKSTITASSDKYFPISEIIDLTKEVENVKVIKDLYVMPIEVGESILLNNIFFETGSTNLKPTSFEDIDRVIDLMRFVPTLKIEIDGHTDSSGKDAFNLALSNSRARSVVEYIYGKGLGEDRVVYKGSGEANPIATNLTAEGRAKNRRVEFVILER